MGMYNCKPSSNPPPSPSSPATTSPMPFPPLPPPAEAMSCGLINSALMGAQQDGRGLEVAGLPHMALCNAAALQR